MGKKAPATTPAVPKPSTKKKPVVLTKAAEEPPAAEVADLHAALQLLDNLSADVLLALAKAKSASAKEEDSDDDWDVKPRSRERLVTLRTDVQARDSQVMKSYAEQMEQIVDGSITITEAVIQAIEPKRSIEKFMVEALSILHRRLKYYSVALKKAGPTAGGSLDAAYEIWQSKRLQFAQQEFKPEELEKSEVEAAVARNRGQHFGRFGNQDKGEAGPKRDFRGNNYFNRPRHSPHQPRRDRSRSRSPNKRK